MDEPYIENEKVWAALSGLKSDYHHINESVKSLTTDFHNFASTIQDTLSLNQRTPWGIMAAWAAVILSIVAIYSRGYIRDMDRLENSIGHHRTEIWNHVRDGHPTYSAPIIPQVYTQQHN